MLLLAISGGASAAWEWRLDAGDGALDPAARAATAQLLETARAALPPGWRDAEGLDVRVRWRTDLPADTHGRSRGDRVLLRRALLDDWMAARGSGSGEEEARARALLAVVLHEFAHRYDRSAHGGLSRDPRLLDLAGWAVRPLRFGLRAGDTTLTDRSPDRYEQASPAEFVAVNLEQFLLDPEYACRRPALHAYFAAHFGWAPAAVHCDPALPFVAAGNGAPGAGRAGLLALDPSRVQAVEYLLAEGDGHVTSRWGHSMLRLVVCAPGRARGPDCRYDLEHHVVLSFRAFVDDVQVSSLRGLTGRYPSRLFVLPMSQVIDEYTRVELRGLQSIPLDLSPGETASLLERAAMLHWSYDGRYRFVDNNCAVETWSLLQTGVPRLAGLRLRSITPTGLLRRLAGEGVADPSVLARGDALRAGYYLPSAAREYQALLDVARDAQRLPVAQVDAWLALPAAERAPWLATTGLRDGAALLVLEHAALRRETSRLRDLLKRRLHRAGGTAGAAPGAEALRAMIDAGDGLSRPASLLAGGYGLPQSGEREVLQQGVAERATLLAGLEQRLHAQAREALGPDERADLEAVIANVDALGQRVREQAATRRPERAPR